MRAPIISLALYLSALLLAPFAQAETATLQHDNSGNVTQRTTPQGTTTYTYDPLNRLTGESGPAKTQTITYDENGNRKSDGAGSYVYETTSNRMSTRLGLAVTFDAAGNMTADGTGRTFAYNQANQLYQVFQGGVLLATYTYDFTGLRIAKVTTASAPQGAQTVIYEYDEQEHLISEISGTSAPLRSYAWRGDTPVAQIEHTSGGDKTLYFDPDHLNTPRAAMDETGKVVWRWESDAFGTTLPDEDPDGDGNKVTINLRFPGQYYDVESGLHYNGHRYYSPLLKIFTQTDRLDVIRQAVNPLYAQYSEPTDLMRALNQPYNYAENDPMSKTDPLGLSPLGTIKNTLLCWYYSQKMSQYTAQCTKECPDDPKGMGQFIDQYSSSGQLDAAMLGCACQNAGPKLCGDWVAACVSGVTGAAKPPITRR